jgi:hypothetical protein
MIKNRHYCDTDTFFYCTGSALLVDHVQCEAGPRQLCCDGILHSNITSGTLKSITSKTIIEYLDFANGWSIPYDNQCDVVSSMIDKTDSSEGDRGLFKILNWTLLRTLPNRYIILVVGTATLLLVAGGAMLDLNSFDTGLHLYILWYLNYFLCTYLPK